MFLEVIVETLKQAKDASCYGADRLELVSAISEGGLTPSLGLIEAVSGAVDIPVQVMLRPHSDSFVYSEDDIKVLLRDLELIKSTKAQGVVFGALHPDGSINEGLLDKVIEQKGHLSLTFHRAVDESKNYNESIALLLSKSINTILTSGGKPTALEGKEILNDKKSLFAANQVELLAGKGLNATSVQEIYNLTGISHVHMGSGVKSGDNIDEQKIKRVKSIGNSL